MDILEVIAENIESKATQNIIKLVDHYLDTNKNKTYFTTFIINLFSQHYINKNLWLLKRFAQELASIDKNKKAEVNYYNICLLLAHGEFKNLNIYKSQQSNEDKNNSIDNIVQGFHKEYNELLSLKESLTTEVYSLCNILYRNIIHCCDLSNSFTIIKYLVSKKKKELFIIDTNDSIIDILFLILINFLSLNDRLGGDIVEYVTLCKDIFYYNCKIKDKIERINILFYAVFILTHRKVKFQEIEYKIPDVKFNNKKTHSNNVEYLYVLIKYDYDLINALKSERELMKLTSRQKKTINIDDSFYPETSSNSKYSSINIIKMQK